MVATELPVPRPCTHPLPCTALPPPSPPPISPIFKYVESIHWCVCLVGTETDKAIRAGREGREEEGEVEG